VKTYFHVTKKINVKGIRVDGLKPSSGSAAGGMSADSQEAYKYAEQDRGLIYMWTDIDHTDKFKKTGAQYALIVVQVDNDFDSAHIDVTKFAKAKDITKANSTTVVCSQVIKPVDLYYLPKKPAQPMEGLKSLSLYGVFNMATGKGDDEIWGGMEE